jgi:MFS family permease
MALLAALLGWMFDGFEMGIFPLLARPALKDILGLTENAAADVAVGLWMGRITAAFLVGAAVGGWTFGWLGDRVGRVRAMIFSVLTYALFTGLCGLAQTPWQLALLRFLAALGMGGEWALGVALVMECWAANARPVLAGLIGAASNVGFVMTAFVVRGVEAAGLPVATGGWRWVFAVCTFPALLTFFIRMFVPESERWQRAVATGPKPRLADIFAPALRQRTLVGALLGGIALIGTWGAVQWIPQWTHKIASSDPTLAVRTASAVGWLASPLGPGAVPTAGLQFPERTSVAAAAAFAQETANRAQVLVGIGAIVGSYFGAVLGSRLKRRWGYFTLSLGSLLACACLFRLFGRATVVDAPFLLTGVVVGGFTAAFYGWLPLYLPELFPTRVRAMGQGFAFNIGRLIAAAGALSMGWLMSASVFNGSYARAGATITLIYAVGLLVIWWAPETRGEPLPE